MANVLKTIELRIAKLDEIIQKVTAQQNELLIARKIILDCNVSNISSDSDKRKKYKPRESTKNSVRKLIRDSLSQESKPWQTSKEVYEEISRKRPVSMSHIHNTLWHMKSRKEIVRSADNSKVALKERA